MEELNQEQTLDGKIAEFQGRLNRMEMLSELEKTDIKNLAAKLYFETLVGGISKAVSDAIDQYTEDPAVRLDAANAILESVGLDPIDGGTSDEIFESFISRF